MLAKLSTTPSLPSKRRGRPKRQSSNVIHIGGIHDMPHTAQQGSLSCHAPSQSEARRAWVGWPFIGPPQLVAKWRHYFCIILLWYYLFIINNHVETYQQISHSCYMCTYFESMSIKYIPGTYIHVENYRQRDNKDIQEKRAFVCFHGQASDKYTVLIPSAILLLQAHLFLIDTFSYTIERVRITREIVNCHTVVVNEFIEIR